ncbi:unnamed protein product [Pieris macdunnoughi]|uniref:FLYWCH-type domain-containing protein n=1 Tax=Pieris macdunnoughi TaxID=345717 RepID=A0A821Q9L6_9NEOP|nr:unnamed protein product [Pieris macdunnoughi]
MRPSSLISCLRGALCACGKVQMIMTQRGKTRLMVKNYTFYKAAVTKRGIRYSCTNNRHCRANVILNLEETEILDFIGTHTHKAPNYVVDGLAHIITVRNGKKFIMLNGYTFCRQTQLKSGTRYTCTQTSICRSYLVVSDAGMIIKAVERHDHKKPTYHMSSDGVFFKI